MVKRVYIESVKKYGKTIGVASIPLSILLIWYLVSLGSIEITGYSGDIVCAGTESDPCNAFINFTAKEDIFIYPSENWSMFYTDIQPKSVKIYRSWGNSWREINLTTNCKGTWCGASDSSGNTKYSFAFREGKNYSIKYEVLKEFPHEDIIWGFGKTK